ncbi:hypothetical protein D9C73_019541 [Collichthys lucidus]|uniref:Uncharacterized protein n=1 Tax=Collichthys lucidus TaxID=240159 RepID=A0A4U5VDT1_COLLU|nr:hypothetical protein D9C73_019541 [Collichthys lucidus]
MGLATAAPPSEDQQQMNQQQQQQQTRSGASSSPTAATRAAVAARLRSASRGSAAFGAEVGRMAEKTAAMDITPRDSRLRCR